MIDKFLKAKHWQLFSLIFGLPMVFQFIMMGTMFSNIVSEKKPDPIEVFNMMKFTSVIMIIYMSLFFGWFWSIAIGTQSLIPENIKMKTKKFKIFFLIPLIYIILFSLFMGYLFSGIQQNGVAPRDVMFGQISGIVGLIFPLHFLSMLGMFYVMYFVAKIVKTVELQKEVSFGDFAGEFFVLCFIPLEFG